MATDRPSLIADTLGRSPATIRWIDEGYDFEVAIVDDEWVFRFPRRAGVEEPLEFEIELLPMLAPALPVACPSSSMSRASRSSSPTACFAARRS